jgi:hypothetical protein
MKTKLLTAFGVLAITACSINTSSASDDKTWDAMADVVAVRPTCFVATVVGTALFVVSLPVAAMSKSVKKSADALVLKPGRATFTRPIGDFKSISE